MSVNILNKKIKEKSYDILIAEDNSDDILLIELAIKNANIKGNLITANNGKRVIKILDDIKAEDKKLPDLILLDINLPKQNGLEVLKKLKSNPETKSISTVIFTSSDSISDRDYSYEHGADLYFKKPNNINDLTKIILNIKEYCLKN